MSTTTCFHGEIRKILFGYPSYLELCCVHTCSLISVLLLTVVSTIFNNFVNREHILHDRPRGYKTLFMLNSTEHEIFHANKSQFTNNAKFFSC